MNGNEVMLLGLGLTPPWKLVDQELDVERKPHELHLHIEATEGRTTRFGEELLGEGPVLEPMRKALQTLQAHAHQIVRRRTSTYTNARLEGLNGLFQAARARGRGYRNTDTFISMIYLIASPAASILKST